MQQKSFQDIHISPRLIKSLSKLQWNQPTEVQQITIPLALAGRDMLVQSVTGSGKTGAFAIPIIERLLLRGKNKYISTIVLSPTRELSEQTALVIQQMINQMPLSCALIVGGSDDFKQQQQILKTEPDIVVATPGRLIDHIVNSTIILNDLEVFILDEADKLLELGFMPEIKKIVDELPMKRQTMLFSATLSSQIEELAALSLQKPLRVNIDPPKSVSKNIQQQFVFCDEFKEKFAILIHLLQNALQNSKLIVFCQDKNQVNKVSQFLRAYEFDSFLQLSSEFSQQKRHQILNEFENQQTSVLISTDLAARGLDLEQIDAVILFNTPKKIDEYIHRVGRTGRYVSKGISITFGTKDEIKTLAKELGTGYGLKERLVSQDEKLKILKQLDSAGYTERLKEVVKGEKEEQKMDDTQKKLDQYEKIQQSGGIEQKILSRNENRRSWFQSEQDKKAVKNIIRQTEQGQLSRKQANQLVQNKQIKQELLKVNRGKQQGQKKTVATEAVRKVKRQMKIDKVKYYEEDRVNDLKKLRYDARKIKNQKKK